MSDLIDRQQAIDALGEEPYGDTDYDIGLRNQWKWDVEAIQKLPSAEPSLQDWQKIVLRTLISERKTGKWIDKGWTGDWQYRIDGRGNCWRDIRCSECNISVRHKSNFCPNCGCKMEVEHEQN